MKFGLLRPLYHLTARPTALRACLWKHGVDQSEYIVRVISIRYRPLSHGRYEFPTNANEAVRNRNLTRCERSLSIVRE